MISSAYKGVSIEPYIRRRVTQKHGSHYEVKIQNRFANVCERFDTLEQARAYKKEVLSHIKNGD